MTFLSIILTPCCCNPLSQIQWTAWLPLLCLSVTPYCSKHHCHLLFGLRLARQPNLRMAVNRRAELGFSCWAWDGFMGLFNFSVRSDWYTTLELSPEWQSGKCGLWRCCKSAWRWLTDNLTWQFARFNTIKNLAMLLYWIIHFGRTGLKMIEARVCYLSSHIAHVGPGWLKCEILTVPDI